MKVDADSQLNSSKQAALQILDMFDNGVVHLINGTNIDQPRNALSLAPKINRLFGDFKIFFTPLPDQPAHTYRIESFFNSITLRDTLPVTRTLHLTKNRTIDPPSPRLLAVHRAIGHILNLSAAGEYIDKIILDMEQKAIQADGSTGLSYLLKLRLDWGLDVKAY
ncbi:hypothetical protein F5884DRAFT_406682 [Xylogone sp. PMI_703]|nr:hypothetical protein F5884DRAFT_406682 [Xylogone sp. PMI_703]